jgi:hypothetical protein
MLNLFRRLSIVSGKRWYRDVFPSLVPRKKRKVERRNVRVDDIVVVQDSNAVRGNWTTGRVVNVFPGKDGKIRNLKVNTATSYRVSQKNAPYHILWYYIVTCNRIFSFFYQ